MNVEVTSFVSGTPDALRDEVLEKVRVAADAESAAWFDGTETGVLTVVRSCGAPEAGRVLATYVGRALPNGAATTSREDVRRLRRGGWTVTQPPPRLRTGFRSFDDDYETREAVESLPVYTEFYVPAGLTDQLRLLAYRERRFVGWIAALRTSGRFTSREQKRLDALVGPTVEGLAAARTLEGLDDDSFLVFDGHGRVEHGTERALAWLSDERAEVFVRCVRVADRGESKQFRIDGVSVRFVRLTGGPSVRYLAMLRDRDHIELRGEARLSPTELAVAEDLAVGLTLREVAALRGCAESTVKTHAKKIYRKLGVANRVELVEALRRGAP